MATSAAAAAAAYKSSFSSSSLSKNLLLRAVGKQPRQPPQPRPRPAMVPSLSRLLVSPSKVATALEWSNTSATSVLTINMTRDAMELLVSSHPIYEEPVQTLPSIPLKTEIIIHRAPRSHKNIERRNEDAGEEATESSSSCEPPPEDVQHRRSSTCRRLVPSVAIEFKQILQDWQVSGIVVNWPVQPEGWCGYACGKVLFVLDHLNSYRCFSGGPNQQPQPLCLWDQIRHDAPYEDEWGRSENYTIVSSQTEHYATRDQYDVAPGLFSAAGVWDDYCRAHWPELYTSLGRGTTTAPGHLRTQSSHHGISHPKPPPPPPPQPWLTKWAAAPTPLRNPHKNWRGSS